MDVIEGSTLEGGSYHEELRIVLPIVEAAVDAFVLIYDAYILITLGAVAFLSKSLEDGR